MKNIIISILIFFNYSGYSQIEEEFEQKAGSYYWINGYKPTEFRDSNLILPEISNNLNSQFKKAFGKVLFHKVIFFVGYEYDLKRLSKDYAEVIKDYKWEIPQYILNYAFYDNKSKIIYYMHFPISKNGEIMKGFIPKINKAYQNGNFITEQEAVNYISSKKLKKKDQKKLKKINLKNGRINYNSTSEVFEWEFGAYDLVWIEAIPNGKIRFGKHGGILDL